MTNPYIMSYHSNLKHRILNNELIGFEVIENYIGNSNRMLLYFKSEPKIRPVLANKIDEYKELLKDINTKFNRVTEGICPIIF